MANLSLYVASLGIRDQQPPVRASRFHQNYARAARTAWSCVGITPTSKSGKMYEMNAVDRLRSSELERSAPVRVYLEAVLSTLPSSNFPQARQKVRSVLYVPMVLRWSRTTSS
jgi:hypothetical protein